MIFAILFGMTLGASARDKYLHDDAVLPPAARSAISKNFKADVSFVKLKKSDKEFEVVLKDGCEVTFDRDGNWLNVEMPKSKNVPDAFLPAGVKTFVQKSHKGEKIVGIERERGGYEVELSNGIELKFDRAGQFVRYDR